MNGAPIGRAIRAPGLPWRLDWIVIANSLLMVLYHATGVGLVGGIGNAFSAAVVLYLLLGVVSSVYVLSRYGLLLLALGFSLTGTILTNLGQTDPVDLLKYLSLYVLYLAARASRQRLRPSLPAALTLILIPLVLLPFGSRIYVGDALGGASFSYFQTYNAAIIYFTAVTFYLAPSLGRHAPPIQLLMAVAFGKIGAILASVLAFAVWNTKLNLRSLAASLLCAAIFLGALQAGLLFRLTRVVGPLWNDLLVRGPTRISRMSFAEIVQRTGTTDISGYFRIKHWAEIWQRFEAQSALHILFGYGPGQTKFTSHLRLVPHNDYLRILVEFGVFNFLCFIALIAIALKNLPNITVKALFTVYVFYSMSDNLIDNFTSIVLLFGAAGLFARDRTPRRVIYRIVPRSQPTASLSQEPAARAFS